MRNIYILIVLLTLIIGCTDTQEDYYPSGQLKSEYEVREGVKHGKVYTYHENGQVELDGQYVNGKREGIYKWYYSNGQLEQETNYNEGKEHGHLKQYYETGELKGEGAFKRGMEEGITKHYYKDGTLEKEQEINDGLQNGYYKSYHTNGQLKLDAYLENEKTVYYVEYNEQGKFIDLYREMLIASASDTLALGEPYKGGVIAKGPPVSVEGAFKILHHGENGERIRDTLFRIIENGQYHYTPKNSGNYMVEVDLIISDTIFQIISKDFLVLEKEGS